MSDNEQNQAKAQQALASKKDFLRQLKAALATHAGGSDSDAYYRGLLMAATVLVQEAIDGREQWAIQELINRIDGKVPQPVGGDDELPPISFKGLIDLVRPKDGAA